VRTFVVRTLSIVLVAGLFAAPDLAAQEEDSGAMLEACSGPEHRQFDFWLGDWQVTDTAGAYQGSNVITRVASGCGLFESWTSGGSGFAGNSLNWYDVPTGQWKQVWVGLGVYLDLSGGLEGGRMVLSGERETPQGTVIDRIAWTPLDDGRVRQRWDVSRDGGTTWQAVFDGIYARRK
jgi:hypothetical protein